MFDAAGQIEFVFEQYAELIFHVAYQYTGQKAQAEDITQDVFLKLLRTAAQFTSQEHLKAWLIRVAVNQSKDYLRSGAVRNTQPLTEEIAARHTAAAEEEAFLFDDTDRYVMEKLACLDPKYRIIIYLYYYENYNSTQIADLMDISRNTVNTWLRRARKRLRMEMEDCADWR